MRNGGGATERDVPDTAPRSGQRGGDRDVHEETRHQHRDQRGMTSYTCT